MNNSLLNSVAIIIIGACITGLFGWGTWMTVNMFKMGEQIALIKQDLEMMEQIKALLLNIQGEFDTARVCHSCPLHQAKERIGGHKVAKT